MYKLRKRGRMKTIMINISLVFQSCLNVKRLLHTIKCMHRIYTSNCIYKCVTVLNITDAMLMVCEPALRYTLMK